MNRACQRAGNRNKLKMKKFCSKCGNQLDLSKRSCTSCQAFNPYFIAGFTGTTEPESASTTETPAVKQKEETAELESLRLGQLEQHKSEQEIKSELLRVKEETEQYKKQTFELVNEVKKELHDIELENKLLKEKVESLKNNAAAHHMEAAIPASMLMERKAESNKSFTAIAAVALLLIVTCASYFFFRHNNSSPGTINAANTEQPVNKEAATTGQVAKSEKPAAVAKDTLQPKKLLAVANVPAAIAKPVSSNTAPITPIAAPVTVKKATPESFTLTESRVKVDLVGKKLSGCDITINNAAEINSISNIALVDKLSATYLKYKCVVKIKQGSDVFTSTPYIYYSAEGTFIKVDGTNCE